MSACGEYFGGFFLEGGANRVNMNPTEKPLDNPINWSFPAGRLFGISIRVHITFVICGVVLVWMQMPEDASSPAMGKILGDALGIYAMLFVIVLAHEFGHCFGARHVGGEADEILIWPLGGLAYANPPHNANAHMVTTVAGPLVNVLICMVCTAILVAWTGNLWAVPWNPLHPMLPVDLSVLATASMAQIWLMRFFGLSYFLLLINLLPVFPFDGGRMVQAWLWPRKGYAASMMIATSTGMIGAVVIGLFGLFTDQSWLLLMIAVFGYLTCLQQRRVLREQEALGAGEFGYDFSRGYTSLKGDDFQEEKEPGFFERRRANKAIARAKAKRQRQETREREIETILAKISQFGMDALTPQERSILEDETQRQRSQSDDSP